MKICQNESNMSKWVKLNHNESKKKLIESEWNWVGLSQTDSNWFKLNISGKWDTLNQHMSNWVKLSQTESNRVKISEHK